MKHHLVALLALALAAVAAVHAGQVTLSTPTAPWTAGSTVPISWTFDPAAQGAPAGTTGSVVLMRVNGNPDNMTPIAAIGAARPEAGSMSWIVPAGIVNGVDYALQWRWDGLDAATFKYSAPFAVQGGTGQTSVFISATSTSASRSATTSATTTSAASTTTTSASASATSTGSASAKSASTATGPAPTASVAPALNSGAASERAAASSGGLVLAAVAGLALLQ
ncbi:hypothetical protein H9P43_008025 [Blastocladiella emersonii ATCC 22665]|nr:hypothetical protein H9P43_008009 [Blastocladiella emersonii ATCC 22665]KAI9168652.1 hypothetical protein H9P43_008025 [Blastocladiella emersonii ATCC 22665]